MQISRGHTKCCFNIDSHQIQSIFVRLCFLSSPEQETPLWEDEGGAEAEAEGKSHKGPMVLGHWVFLSAAIEAFGVGKVAESFLVHSQRAEQKSCVQGSHLEDVCTLGFWGGVVFSRSFRAWFLWNTLYFPSDQQWVATHPGRVRVRREDLRAWFPSNTLKPVEEMAHTSASVM